MPASILHDCCLTAHCWMATRRSWRYQAPGVTRWWVDNAAFQRLGSGVFGGCFVWLRLFGGYCLQGTRDRR